MMRGVLPLIIFAGIAVAFAIGLTKDPRRMETTLINQAFPPFALETLYEPEKTETEALLTGQVSLINVFGSWCVTCNVEHPILMDIAKDKSIRLIGHNWRDDREKAKQWLARRGDPYEIIIFDPDSELAIPLGVVGAPETFITDKQGRIRYKHSGAISYEDWEGILKPLILSLTLEIEAQ
jgi:cytochrome c biogenesis protein CcmG/thiol:disulfide interchange protein DsbE